MDLTRRQILGAVGTAGGTGVLAGTSTGALLTDSVTFAESGFAAGGVDLRVDWTVDDGASGSSENDASIAVDLSGEDPSGRASITVRLPEDGANNPAYGWLRLSCPEHSRLVDALSVDLRYDCGDRGSLADGGGTLCDVANDLRDGVLLDPSCAARVPGEQGCLQPGEPLELALEWTLASGFEGSADTSLEFEVAGYQCRNQDGTTNPFENARPEPCDCPTGHDVSWAAFCAADGETIDPADLSFDVTADTLELSDAPSVLDAVVLKAATEITVFDDPGTSGTFVTGDDANGTVYEQSGNGFVGTDRSTSVPCPDGCGLKFEGDDGFDSADSKGCDP
jgi:hypothetical protein